MSDELLLNLYPAGELTGWLTISYPDPAFVPSDGERVPMLTKWANDTAVAATIAAELAPKNNVYVGLGLRRARGSERQRGAVEDVVVIPGVWADFDVAGDTHTDNGKHYFPTKAAVQTFLDGLPAKPSIVVDSGGGLHAYWLFREPWLFEDDAERLDAAAVVEGWQRFLQRRARALGFDIDSTFDLARVLRVAPSLNHKVDPPLRVSVIHSDGPRYNPGDFSEWAAPAGDGAPAATGAVTIRWDAEAPAKFEALLVADPRTRATWDHRRPDLRDQTPTGYTMALANVAVTAGWTDQEIADLLVAARRHYGADRKYAGWYARTIAKARERSGGVETPARSYLLTDTGNAERFAAEHAQEVHYCFAWNKWMVFDGQRWALDDRGRIFQLAKETTRNMLTEAAQEPDDDKRKARIRHAIKADSRAGRDAMLALARSEPGIPITPEELDCDPWLLNVENGTIDLHTGTLRPHQREDLITKLAPVQYDLAAAAPRWARFLEEVLPDPELRRFLQAATGYALTGDVSDQVLFFLYGLGANGKSVYLGTVQTALGDYAVQVVPDLLMARKGEHHPTELTDLYRRRFVATIEADEGRRFNEAGVKWLTGGDKIRARRMQEDFWQFNPTHKIFLAANTRPVIRGNDLGIWRRVRLVPFVVTISEQQRDPHLIDTLKDESAGILRWAVEGCLLWQREGLRAPDAVKAATGDYQAEMDLVGRFISDRCIVGTFAQVAAGDLYKSFLNWCTEGREREFSQQTFGRRLTDRGFARERRRSGHWWTGIGLLTAESTGEDTPGVTDVTLSSEFCGSFPEFNSRVVDPEKGCTRVTRVTAGRDREPDDDDEPLRDKTDEHEVLS